MHQNRNVRVIKRDERENSEPAAERRTANPGREAQSVVSGWVREHQQRTEEYQRNYSELLAKVGLGLPRRSYAQ